MMHPTRTASRRRLLLSRRCLVAICTGTILLPLVPAPSVFAHDTRAQTTPAAKVTVPRLNYQKRTLANGLIVLSVENHQSPTVAVQVWYRVGGKNDPEGKSGFAHLFEHLLFKSTRNLKSEQFDRLTEDVGGENNAYTAEDRTVYHETVPSNYLESILWAEAERLANLNVDEANFKSERAVVEEEYRQSVLAPPYGKLSVLADEHSYTTHPYRRGVIGSIENLDAATVEDVRKFHADYYRPDNATLVVAGDFDPKQLDAWVDKYFGRVQKPAGDVPRVTVQEPARTGEKRFDETGPNVPLPATVITFLVPPVTDADAPALQVAEVILGRGDSSRLNQSLVYRQQIAAQASASADLRQDSGLFQFTTLAAGGKSPADAEKATLAEIEKIQSAPVAASELEKARNVLLSDTLEARETADGQAAALGNAAVTLGDAERVNTDIARLQAVTAADVQRVAKQYFTPQNRVTITYQNAESAPSVPPAAAASDAVSGTWSGLVTGTPAGDVTVTMKLSRAEKNVTGTIDVAGVGSGDVTGTYDPDTKKISFSIAVPEVPAITLTGSIAEEKMNLSGNVGDTAIAFTLTRAGATPATPDTPATPQALSQAAPAVTPAAPQEVPPTPAAPRPVSFPTPTEKKLANGLRVIVVPRRGTGLVSVVAAVKAGGAREQDNQAGLADFTASLLTRGTRTRSATQIAETVEALGGSLGSGAGWDSATVSLSSLGTRLGETLPVMADVLRNPAFSDEEIERLRAENLDGLSIGLRAPGTLARYAAARVVWGDTAYGHNLGGTPETLKSLNGARVRRFYGEYFRPQNTTLVFSGDITPEDAFARAQTAFGDWKGPNVAMTREMLVPPPAPKAQRGGRVVVIDKPDAGQAAVLLVRPAIRRADKDYLTGQVFNSVLGGGYSARLNQEIRIKRGLSYGAGSGLDARGQAGQFAASAQTRNDAVPQVASLLQSELARLGSTPPPGSELLTRKAALSGGYARGLETGAGLAGAVASLAVYDLPLSRLREYLPGVQAVTGEQIARFTSSALKPSDASLVIVGDGRKFLTELKKQYPQAEVIPVDKLDLNRADLRKP